MIKKTPYSDSPQTKPRGGFDPDLNVDGEVATSFPMDKTADNAHELDDFQKNNNLVNNIGLLLKNERKKALADVKEIIEEMQTKHETAFINGNILKEEILAELEGAEK